VIVAYPFFSIIIPTFNSERTVSVALSSVINQEFKDVEILVIDAESSDNTIQIISEFEAKDSRIRHISEKDQGIYDAMNKGVALANGEWIYFLGSDDWLKDMNVLQAIADELQKEPADLLYGNVMMQPSKKTYDGPFTVDKLFRRNISHQSIFYRRNLFDKLGNYNLAYKLHADWDFNIRCFLEPGITTRFVNTIVACFAKGGVSSAHDKIFLKEIIIPRKLKSLALASGLLKNIKLYDEYWRLFRNAGIRNEREVNETLPSEIVRLLKFQRSLPSKLLRTGIFSKFFMTLSYCGNLFIKSH
jgi:glycosyltransferase involved in cell wall biosynthesis